MNSSDRPEHPDRRRRRGVCAVRIALFAVAVLVAGVVLQWPTAMAATAFGPAQWTQYRMRATHNAVFSNGSPTLPDGHFHTDGEVRATPVVVGNRLYVGNHLNGGLFAFDVRTGKQLWGNLAPYWRHAPNWVHDDMIYAAGRVYLGYGNRVFENADVRGTGASGVMALNPATGATLWNHPTRGEVMPAPAFWHGEILAATGGARVLALNAKTGATWWTVKLPGWVSMSSPAIEGSTLYVGALNSVVAVDLKSHKIAWEYHETGSFTDVPPAISNDGILVITAVKPYSSMTAAEKKRWPQAKQWVEFIYGLNAGTGKLLWKTLMGYGPYQINNTSGAPTIAEGKAYVGSPYTDSFFCFNVKTGKKLWEYRVNAKVKGAPVIQRNLVFFGDTKGYLHVLDAATGWPPRNKQGELVSKRRVGGSLTDAKAVALAPGGPIIINDDVFVGSQDGFVYRISIPHWLAGPEDAGAAETSANPGSSD